MEQRCVIRNVAGSIFALGLTLSMVGSNTTLIDNGDYSMQKNNYCSDNNGFHANNKSYNYSIDNIYLQNHMTKLEREVQDSFGVMRDATQEEMNSVNNYIISIAQETGVNFFDLC